MDSLEEHLVEQVEAPAKESTPFRFQLFSSLRHLDFRYLAIGTFMMSAGQWIQQVTLGWLVYDLTGNSMLPGALNGWRALPFFVTGPMAGVAADRMARKNLLLRTQWGLRVHAGIRGAGVIAGLRHGRHTCLVSLK